MDEKWNLFRVGLRFEIITHDSHRDGATNKPNQPTIKNINAQLATPHEGLFKDRRIINDNELNRVKNPELVGDYED